MQGSVLSVGELVNKSSATLSSGDPSLVGKQTEHVTVSIHLGTCNKEVGQKSLGGEETLPEDFTIKLNSKR